MPKRKTLTTSSTEDCLNDDDDDAVVVVVIVDKQKEIEEKKKKLWSVVPSEFSLLCTNPIRKIVDNISKPTTTALSNNSSKSSSTEEKELIPLSLGDPTVFGNLKCPQVMIDAIVKNVKSQRFNGYVHSAGMEVSRQAIATKHSSLEAPLTKEDIIIASGCSGALDIALSGLLNPGDNILLPKPGFPLYQVICEVHKVECRFYDLLPEKNWQVDLDHLESLIDEHTKVIMVTNPSNPCGSVYQKSHLEKILFLADHHKLPIIADEIYGDMVFDQNIFHPLATLTKTVPVIAVGGLAKQYLVPGWRVGWIMLHDRNDTLKDVRTAYFKLSQLILGANSLIQSVIPAVLTPTHGSTEEASLIQFKQDYMSILQTNASFTLVSLQHIHGLTVVVPQGAMYVMVKIDTTKLDLADDFEFTQMLLDEESVFVLPGQCFGMKNYFRVVFSAPKDKLNIAYNRIASFCERHRIK